MFTIKLSSRLLDDGGEPTGTVWIARVHEVSRIGSVKASKAVEEWAAYQSDLIDYVECWLLTAEASESQSPATVRRAEYLRTFDPMVSLLSVQLGDGDHRFVVVEQAWLLGPGGGTVDRLTPNYV